MANTGCASVHRFYLEDEVPPLACNESFDEAKRDFISALEGQQREIQACIVRLQSFASSETQTTRHNKL